MEQKSNKDLSSLAERYDKMLRLTTFPVAVKLFDNLADLEKVRYKGKPIKLQEKRLAVCQIFAQARYYGRLNAAKREKLDLCRLGADAFGFPVTDYTHVYSGTYFNGDEAARKMIETTPKFKKDLYKAILVAPFEKTPVDPDVVLFYGNTAQILRLVHGYLYDKGGRLEFSASGDAGACADPVVIAMQTRRPSIGLPCNGGRILSWPSDNDLVCGVPGDLLEEVLLGIEATHFGPGQIRYPIAWQHIDWEAQPPVTDFLYPEKAKGKKGE